MLCVVVRVLLWVLRNGLRALFVVTRDVRRVIRVAPHVLFVVACV